MKFQQSMLIPSLYSSDDQAAIERWIEKVPVYPEAGDLHDSNRVAEIALSSVQRRLPQGWSIKEEGSTVIERKTWDCPVRMRELFFPIHLFDIDWAENSFPEMVWLETYYATLLPGYNVYAVTFSQGSDESYDYFDLAIGCFTVDHVGQIAEKASRIVAEWWQYQLHEWNQWAWRDVVKSGLIDASSAFRLRDEVWLKVETSEGVIS